MERNQLQFLMIEFTQERVHALRKEYHMDDEVAPVRNITNGGPYLFRRGTGEHVVTDGNRDFCLQNIPIFEAQGPGQDASLREESELLPQDQRGQMANLARQLNDIVDRFSEQEHRVTPGNNSAPARNDLTLEEARFYANMQLLNTVNIHQIAHLLSGIITRRTLQIALDFIIANTSGSLSIGLALDLSATLLALRYMTIDEVALASEWILDYIIQHFPNWRRYFF